MKRKPAVKEFEIFFSVQGYVTQTVEIVDPKMTPAKLQTMLNNGKACTTIQEGGTVDITASGKVIARVRFVDNNCEYSDFEVEDTEE
jgi:hypothetical protein